MTAKEYLSRYHNTKVKIEKLQALVDTYIRLANEIPGIQFDAIRVDGGKSLKAPFEKWILKTLDYEIEIKEMKRKLPGYKKEAIQAIEEIEDQNYQLILVYRYIDWLSWRQIAERMFFSSATIRRWHDKALLELEID
jgi:hypothetical protein